MSRTNITIFQAVSNAAHMGHFKRKGERKPGFSLVRFAQHDDYCIGP
jgi:hypothetical protein